MPERNKETTSMAKKDPEAQAEGAEGKAEKERRSLNDRAMASVRNAGRTMREVNEPEARARFMLAEANVLALLDLADAIRNSSLNGKP
jgi:hypothetical protein